MAMNRYIPNLDDFKNMCLTIKFELLKHIKRKRILITLILAILIPLIFFAVPPLLGEDYVDTANSFASVNLGFISMLIIISGAIFAGDCISSEFDKKTGLLLFPTPQKKTSIFVGKYIASIIATWFIVSIYYLVTASEITAIYGASGLTVELGQSFLLALLYASSVVSIIFFFSSIMKKPITSTLIGFFFLMMILPITTNVLMAADVDPAFLVTHSADLITDVLGSGPEASFGPGQDFGLPSFEPELWNGIAVMSAYTIILFFTGIVMADRRKME